MLSNLLSRGRYRARSLRSCTAILSLVVLACAVTLIPDRPAQAAQQESGGSLQRAFDSASNRWQVPLEVLLAVGYVESRWEQRGGMTSLDQGYGIMHLVDGAGGSLERAQALTRLPADAIKIYPQANIDAGAAILRDISLKNSAVATKQQPLSEWYTTVAAYSRAADPVVADNYAQEVFRIISEGRNLTTSTNERIVLVPTTPGALPKPLAATPNSDDYGPAFWVPANQNNYSSGRSYGPLKYIVIHDTEGSYNSAISWFQNPGSGVSAQYVIRSSDGQVTQMVRNADTAYHAGNWDYNVRSLGIEHEGFMNQQGWYTEAMYRSSSDLARTMADRFNMRKDRASIIAHSEVPGATHQDPGSYWNWNYYMGLIRRDSLRAALVDNTDAGFVPIPSEIDPSRYWWTYGNGYGGSSSYVTTSTSMPSGSRNSGEWSTVLPDSGIYDVYAFIPWVDNNIAETANARYKVYGSDGETLAVVSQRAITNVGSGSWAHLGRFRFTGGDVSRVYLDDYTGETGRNVWFDAVMWIPSDAGEPMPTSTWEPPTPTRTSAPTYTRTPTRTRTSTPTRTPTRAYTVVSTSTLAPTRTGTPTPTWTPGPCGMRFSDLPETHWSYTNIGYLYCRGVVSGYADGTFRVSVGSTRSQFAKMITLAMNWSPFRPEQPTFRDVGLDNIFFGYVEAASAAGILTGYPDGTFRPMNPLTRAQVAKMIVLAKLWDTTPPTQPSFSDVAPDDWAFLFVETAYSHGIIGGYNDGSFRPNLPVTRAQLAKMLALSMQQAAAP